MTLKGCSLSLCLRWTTETHGGEGTHRDKGTGLPEQEPDLQPAPAWPRAPHFSSTDLAHLIRERNFLQAQNYVNTFKRWRRYVRAGNKALPPREAPRIRDDTKAQASATLGRCGTWNRRGNPELPVSSAERGVANPWGRSPWTWL